MTEADPTNAPALVLLGGPGGAGTSRATAALAARLVRSGQRVAVADLDPWHGASARLVESPAEVLPRAADVAVDSAAALLDRVGLDPRLAAEVAGLPGMDAAEMLHRLALASGRPDLDVVLVDLGSRLLEVVVLADRLPWLSGHLLRAQRGWLSSTRPRTAGLLHRWPGADGHAAAKRFKRQAGGWSDLVRGADTVLVGDPSDPRLRRHRVGLALHELPAPDGEQAESIAEWSEMPRAVRGAPATWIEHGDGWTWRLALPGLRSQELRVDRSGDDLALEVLGVRRLVPLPSALRRFRATGARVTAGHLEITFVPKESST